MMMICECQMMTLIYGLWMLFLIKITMKCKQLDSYKADSINCNFYFFQGAYIT